MSVIYRPARPYDLDAGARVVQRAMNELRPRHGLAMMPSPPPIAFPAFCLDRDPEGLWVAEDGGSIIGWSFSWRHQPFWFLSQLDVVPEAQGKGVGQALLNNTLRWARQQGVVDRALITFAFNSHSIGLYIRNGFHARLPLYLMSAPADVVARKIETEAAEFYEVGPHTDVSAARAWMGRIDEEVLGFRRDAYHAFLMRTDPAEAMAITRDGEPVGYCYLSKSGHIGPLAITSAANGRRAVGAVVRRALAGGSAKLSIIVPGPADVLMSAASDFGFRIVEPLLLMAERAFGDWHRYMPRSPGHM